MRFFGMFLATISAGLLISASAMLYCQLTLFYWFQSHGPSQGMPVTKSFEIIETIAQPAYWIKRQMESR